MKHLINNATQGTEEPWVALNEGIVYYSGSEEDSSLTKVWFLDGTTQEIDLGSIYGVDSSTPSTQFAQSALNITKIEIGTNVTSIGNYAFANCSELTSISIPTSVTSIGSGALMSCTSLTSITIPTSITSIGGSAFGGCTSLTSIYCNSVNEPCSVAAGTFPLNNSNIIGTLYVKKGGTASTYSTWMDGRGNLGNSSMSGRWTVVEYFD